MSSTSAPALMPLNQSTSARKKRPSFRPTTQLQRQQTTAQVGDNTVTLTTENTTISNVETLTAKSVGIVAANPENPAPSAQSQQHFTDFNCNTTQKPRVLSLSMFATQGYNDTNAQSTQMSIELEGNSSKSTIHDSIAGDIIPVVKTGFSSTRKIHLAKLNAKKRKLKTQGVAIVGAGSGTIRTDVTNTPVEFSPKILTTVENEPVLPEKSRETTITNASSSSTVNLSHYPSIQLPPTITLNSGDKPTLSSFCSTFKVKKPRKKRQQKQRSQQPDAPGTNSRTNDRNKNGSDSVDNHRFLNSGTGTSASAYTDKEIGTVATNKQGPSVQIVNGEIVLQEKSLEYEANDAAIDNDKNNSYYTTVVEEESQLAIINASYNSFLPDHKQRRNNWWTDEETMQFYIALRQVGVDFGTMEAYFEKEQGKARNRQQLKRKYQMELVRNPGLVEMALDPKSKIEIDLSIFDLTEQAVRDLTKQREQDEEQQRIRAAEAARILEATNENEETKTDIFEIQKITENQKPTQLSSCKEISKTRSTPRKKQAAKSTDTISGTRNTTWSIFEDEPPPDAAIKEFENSHSTMPDQPIESVVEPYRQDDEYDYKDPLFSSEDSYMEKDEVVATSHEETSKAKLVRGTHQIAKVTPSILSKKKSKPNFRLQLRR